MASYEIRQVGKSAKGSKVEHDKDRAIALADTLQTETGAAHEVYEIKQVYMTTEVKGADIDFF